MEKQFQYATQILSQLQEMFDEDCSNFINIEELQKEENLKAFLHALATIAPATIFNKLTGDDKNNLEFNHVANILCFEFALPPSKSTIIIPG